MAAAPAAQGPALSPEARARPGAAARPALAARAAPGRKGPELPLGSWLRPRLPAQDGLPGCRRCTAGQLAADPSPTTLPPGPRLSCDHPGLLGVRRPEPALRPAGRRAVGAGPAPNGRRPLLYPPRGGTPREIEPAFWPRGLEAGRKP
nr:translation initiation factor IF-2-like [Saimiri boliviensis boliviensis]